MNKFSTQLKLSFLILSAFALFQAGLTLWVAYQSDYHIEKGRVSNQILTEFIDLGGNKQRLKVWFAQYLLTNDSSIDNRNNLIFKMNNSLLKLNSLLRRDLELSDDPHEKIIINEQIQRYETLKINLNALEVEVMKISKGIYNNPGDAWKYMIQVFDNLDGNDLRKLIGNAIEIQKIRAAEAETTSKNYIEYFNKAVYVLTGAIFVLTILLVNIIQKSVQQPVYELAHAAQEFSKGNISHRIKKIRINEFDLVANKINEMAEELEKLRNIEFKKRQDIEKEVQDRTSELKLAIDQLQKSEFERKIFLSNISHELKTPATAILGETSVTLRGNDKDIETYKETLKNIQIIGRQLANRIEDLLLLARTDSEIFRVNLKTESISRLHQTLIDALKITNPNQEFDFQIRTHFELKSSIQILFDYDRMTQLFVILFDNAKRYVTQSKEIIVNIEFQNHNLIIRVINQFEYLEDIDFNKIFDRYYRSHKARLIKPDGLGIGLFLAQKIIDVHYGKIQARREHNEFVIEITIPTES